MGIKLLNTFLKYNKCDGIYEKHLSEFYGKKICIDISIYMYRYKSEEQLVEKIYLLCILLKYYNIKGLFVFDGKPPKEKNDTIQERRRIKEDAEKKILALKQRIENNEIEYKNYEEEIKILKKRAVKLTIKEIYTIKDLIVSLGMNYIDASGEADVLCAELMLKKKVSCCLSEDTDMFVYPCNYIMRYLSLSNHKVIFYDVKKILQCLDITKKEFIDICLLSGNDYYSGNKNIFYYYKQIKKFKKSGLQLNFKEWLIYKNLIEVDKIEELEKNKLLYAIKNSDLKLSWSINTDRNMVRKILKQDNFLFVE
jgi:flap endonuclease-1